MNPPAVLHVVRDWVRPSEGFVAGLIGSCEATRPVVACGKRWPGMVSELDVQVRDLGRLADPTSTRPRDRRTIRAALVATAIADRAKLLHAHFGYWAPHAARTAHRLRRRWVLSLWGHDLLVEDRDAPERDILRTADLVIVPTGFFADCASRAGFADERIRVLPTGVDLNHLQWRESPGSGEKLTVTFAGRFVAKKGILDAAAAISRAQTELPGLRSIFVGGGPMETELRDALAGTQAELRDGMQPGAVAAAIEESDILLMPSRTAPNGDAESLGYVAIEAQACGVPVIATRHGGLTEAVGPDSGELFAEGDVPAMADAIVRLARDNARRSAMGRAGREYVERRFELRSCTEAVEAAYFELLRATRPVE